MKMWVDYWGPKGMLAPSKIIGGGSSPPGPRLPMPMTFINMIMSAYKYDHVCIFALASKPGCKYIECSSWGYRYQKCTIAGANQVQTLAVVQRHSRSSCSSGRSFGISGSAVWVNRGCRAKFVVCYKRRY